MTKDMDCVIKDIAKRKGIGGYSHHLLYCGGEKCTTTEDGDRLWQHIKKRFKENTNLAEKAFRTRTKCLRICCQGPIAVIYPEGLWYANVDEKLIDRIIDEHILGGQVVADAAFAVNPI